MACAGPCNDPSRHQIATHGGSRRDAQLHPIQLLGEDLQNQRELLEGAGTLACLPTLRGRWRGLILGACCKSVNCGVKGHSAHRYDPKMRCWRPLGARFLSF